MVSHKTTSTLFLFAAGLAAMSIACSGGISTTSNSSGTPAPAQPQSTAKPASSERKGSDIAGKYEASGRNPDGGGEYKADLTVTQRGDVYQFSWAAGQDLYDGVGVMNEDRVAVAFTNGDNGKGCGVVLYKIASDGALSGKVGYWGTNTIEAETAARQGTASTDLEGDYNVSGKNPEGKSYTATLNVKKSGDGYAFSWGGANPFNGFGIRAGEYIAVGFGGPQCAFVGYDVLPDGTLDGKWGGKGSTKFGTEIARPKK